MAWMPQLRWACVLGALGVADAVTKCGGQYGDPDGECGLVNEVEYGFSVTLMLFFPFIVLLGMKMAENGCPDMPSMPSLPTVSVPQFESFRQPTGPVRDEIEMAATTTASPETLPSFENMDADAARTIREGTIDDKLKYFTDEFGYDKEVAQKALEETSWDVDAALNKLLGFGGSSGPSGTEMTIAGASQL